MGLSERLGRRWFELHILIAVVGFLILVYYDVIFELSHGVLRMFMSFFGMAMVVIGNMGIVTAILDNGRKKNVKKGKT